MERAERRGNKRRDIAKIEAELALPELPSALEYLWRYYLRLRRRAPRGFDREPVTWEAMDAFIRRAGIRMAPWECEVLEMLDDTFLAAMAGDQPAVAMPEGKVREVAAMSDADGVRAIMGAVGNRRVVVRKRG